MFSNPLPIFLSSTLLTFAAVGCGDDDMMVDAMTDSAMNGPDGSVPDANVQGATAIEITQEGLPLLANGFLYEGWAIIDGAPVSTGKFNVDGTGTIIDREGLPIADALFETGRDLSEVEMFVLTIEPAGDDDLVPSDTKILAGEAGGSTSTLTLTGGSASLGEDFSGAAGSYILATPTNGADNNEASGVWFIGGGEPTLDLPALPAGWTYEGWTVIAGQPVSMGRFDETDAADDFSGFSGAMPGPPVPGEDFLQNAPDGLTFPINLANGESMVVVSVEPVPDDSVAPFFIKPLVATVPASAEVHESQVMTNNGLPTASVTITLQ